MTDGSQTTRMPAAFIRKENSALRLYMWNGVISGSGPVFERKTTIDLNQTISIHFTQTKHLNKVFYETYFSWNNTNLFQYISEVKINGEIIETKQNFNPQQLSNLRIYTCFSDFAPIDGIIYQVQDKKSKYTKKKIFIFLA